MIKHRCHHLKNIYRIYHCLKICLKIRCYFSTLQPFLSFLCYSLAFASPLTRGHLGVAGLRSASSSLVWSSVDDSYIIYPSVLGFLNKWCQVILHLHGKATILGEFVYRLYIYINRCIFMCVVAASYVNPSIGRCMDGWMDGQNG